MYPTRAPMRRQIASSSDQQEIAPKQEHSYGHGIGL